MAHGGRFRLCARPDWGCWRPARPTTPGNYYLLDVAEAAASKNFPIAVSTNGRIELGFIKAAHTNLPVTATLYLGRSQGEQSGQELNVRLSAANLTFKPNESLRSVALEVKDLRELFTADKFGVTLVLFAEDVAPLMWRITLVRGDSSLKRTATLVVEPPVLNCAVRSFASTAPPTASSLCSLPHLTGRVR